MELNVIAVIILILFYIVILIVGVVTSWYIKRRTSHDKQSELAVVAGRKLNMSVGIFTMTATIVGGGYINGTAESVAVSGLVWTLAPFGIFVGLIIGGVVYAKKMRDELYLTMLDPIQQKYGHIVVIGVYVTSLCGDIFWTAAILSALGTSLSVMIGVPVTVAIVISAAIVTIYTFFGHIISVAYTDVVQLLFITFGLCMCTPFVLTHPDVADIAHSNTDWLGSLKLRDVTIWCDLLMAMTFGTIPWQSYFQRVLSVKSGRQAQVLSIIAAFGAIILVIPSVLIGAAGTNTNWTSANLTVSPLESGQANLILPLMLYHFTPSPIAILGLGAISAAVMSSMDSAILASSPLFTHNIFKYMIVKKPSDVSLIWVQRIMIVLISAVSTVLSIFSHTVYGMFILAADIVFVINLPQLTSALYLRWTNSYGAVTGLIVALFIRLSAGEPELSLPCLIKYPLYDFDLNQQLFPFRTFAMFSSFLAIILVSIVTNALFESDILPKSCDVLNCCTVSSEDIPVTASSKEVNELRLTKYKFVDKNNESSVMS